MLLCLVWLDVVIGDRMRLGDGSLGDCDSPDDDDLPTAFLLVAFGVGESMTLGL